MTGPAAKPIRVGRIVGAHGVKGWVRVRSFTEPVDNILRYRPWRLEGRERSLEARPLEGRAAGQGELRVRLEGIDSREQAESLRALDIVVDRTCFAALPADTYYWADLVGAKVVTRAGVPLGEVVGLLETGAHDVLRVRAGDRERLIPFVIGHYVSRVDLDAGCLEVDWDPDF